MAGRACDVVVIGAGLAGAATAFFLSRARGLRILVLEREAQRGRHSSGRNAGLIGRAGGPGELDEQSDEGAAFLADPPDDFPRSARSRRTGSLLLVASGSAADRVHAGSRRRPAADVEALVPAYRAGAAIVAIETPDDAVADPVAVLDGFLGGARARGADVRFGEEALGIELDGARVHGVRTRGGRIACAAVVDAAGAWAGPIGRAAGALDRGLAVTRRHLAVTAADRSIDPDWPWLWDLAEGFYFRPESGGALVCPCDDDPHEADDCAADPAVVERLRSTVARRLPASAATPFARSWAGLRTRAPGSSFVLGADERVAGFVWAAGLGGHGVTCAASVGRRVAEAVVRAL
jgi:glycine/D-amino acid oxidase-like deaminating enzyme